MYQIELRRRAQRALDRLPKKDFNAVIKATKKLAQTPRPRDVEKLKSTGLWRIWRGDYRIIFAIDDERQTIIILRVGHRREIYRRL